MKKFVYFKLFQLVFALVFMWQILSVHQFCGEFAAAKTFLFDAMSSGQCKRFTLIGIDSTSGEYGALFDEQKWRNELQMMSINSGQPNEQQQMELIDKLASQAPTAGRHCFPISISPIKSIMRLFGKDKTHLDNVVDLFTFQLIAAVCSLAAACNVLSDVLRSSKYEFTGLFYCLFCWCYVALCSSLLLLHWTSYWFCTNFRADATDVPLITLVLSIVMALSFVAEIFFNNLLLHNGPVSVDAAHNRQPQKKAFCQCCRLNSAWMCHYARLRREEDATKEKTTPMPPKTDDAVMK